MPKNNTSEEFRYDDYVREREHLTRYEFENYGSFSRAILTLSSAFLALSVSFLALLRQPPQAPSPPPAIIGHPILIVAWLSLVGSVLTTLLLFLVGALALRFEVAKIEKALDDAAALRGTNYWHWAASSLYVISGIAFFTGVLFLILFTAVNFLPL